MNFNREIIKKILRNKKRIENKLGVSISIKNNAITLRGEEAEKYVAEKVIDALEKNFPVNVAILLANEDYMTEEINIKNVTNKNNLKIVRGRIIGKRGKALELMRKLSGCYITLHDNRVSIIGHIDNMKIAVNAVKSLIAGSKHGNVFSYLEKKRGIDRGDIVLKE